MEALRSEPAAPRAARAARVTVHLSLLLAVVAGVWLIAQSDTRAGIAALVTCAGAAALARWRVTVAVPLLLFFAYTSTGLLLKSPSFIPLWLAALAGVTTSFSWREWRAPASWQWPIMLWLLGIALSWPIIFTRETDFGHTVPLAILPMVVFGAVGAICTGLWLDTLLSWDRDTIRQRVALPLLASALVSAGAVFYQAFVDITWLSGEPWTGLHRAVGLMADANPMAIAAALCAPLAPLVISGGGRWTLGLALTILLWYAAWLTGARSVLLLVPAGALGLLGGLIATQAPRRRFALGAAVIVLAMALAVLIVAQAPATSPIARLGRSLPLDQPGAALYEASWRRDGYGLAAVRAIREHPLNGVGNAMFRFLSPYYYRLEGGDLIPPDNAQNLWRQALAERGLLAFPAVVVLTIVVARLLLRRGHDAPAWHVAVLKALTVGIGLTLTFGLPTQDPAIALSFASVLAWLHASVERSPAPSLDRRLVAAAWVLAVAGAAVDVWTARADLRPPDRAARLGDPYLYGFGDLEEGRGGARGRVVDRYAVVSLKPSGARYNMRGWARGTEPRELRVWVNRRLVVDEAIPAGVIIERLLDAPTDGRGMLLEFKTEPPGVVVTGDFVR